MVLWHGVLIKIYDFLENSVSTTYTSIYRQWLYLQTDFVGYEYSQSFRKRDIAMISIILLHTHLSSIGCSTKSMFGPYGYYFAHPTILWERLNQECPLVPGISDPQMCFAQDRRTDEGTVDWGTSICIQVSHTQRHLLSSETKGDSGVDKNLD